MAYSFAGKAHANCAYDAANGSPVGIKSSTLSVNDIVCTNLLVDVTPIGSPWPVFRPSGSATVSAPQLSLIFAAGDESIDALFGDRAPESPDAATRTLTVTYHTGRSIAVETRLKKYEIQTSGDLVRATVDLAPDGTPTVVGA